MQTEDPDVTYMREVWMNKSNKKAKRQSGDINMSVWMMVLMMAMITGIKPYHRRHPRFV